METYPELFQDKVGQLSRSAWWSIVLGALVLCSLVQATPLDSGWRMGAIAGLALLTVVSLRSLFSRGVLWAARLLIGGVWLIVTAVSFAGQGMLSPLLSVYPLLLVFTGWMLGVGACLALFALSSLAVVMLVTGQAMGWAGRAGPSTESLAAVTVLVLMALSVLLTLFLLRVFLARYAAIKSLNSQSLANLQTARAREGEFRLLAENIPGLVFECDARGRCVFVNQRLAHFFGKSLQALKGTPMVELLGNGSVRDFSAYQAAVLRGDVVEFDMRRMAPDGVWCNLEVTLVPRQAEDSARVVGWYGMVYDVTRRERNALELRERATHDSLTGLPNRLFLHDRLQHALGNAIRRKKSVAVMFIDLDNFKRVNDIMGHAAGDQFLREIARRLTGAIRTIDTAVRLGGDEFVVIAEEIDSTETASLIADKILSALMQPVRIDATSVASGGSIGIALGPQDGATGEALLQAADAALYEAKAAGRKCYRIFKLDAHVRSSHERIRPSQVNPADRLP